MSWENRDYYRNRTRPGEHPLGWLGWLLFSSFHLVSMFGIRVRVHASFVIMIAIQMIAGGAPVWTLRWTGLLFLSVLLHEFGHCFACRSVGGQADEILLWPLGGLASVDAPRRVWPQFVTVVWGPLVNVLLALGCWVVLRGWELPLWNFVAINPLTQEFFHYVPGTRGLVLDLYVVNYSLAIFNLALVFYPFDGGRLVQIGLWAKYGYGRSMRWATTVGLWGAAVIGVFALVTSNIGLFILAFFGGLACYQQAQFQRMEAAGGDTEFDDLVRGREPPRGYAARAPDPSRDSWLGRRRREAASRKAARARRERESEQAEVDRILDKVREHGLQSITRAEKRTLERATETRRKMG